MEKEILLKLLLSVFPLIEAATATEYLLQRYLDLSNVMSAPLSELKSIACLGSRGAKLLKCVQLTAASLAQSKIRSEPLFKNWPQLIDYLNIVNSRERRELFRVLLLDAKNYLISDLVLAEGIETWVSASAREVVKHAVQFSACSVLLVHNHPSGDPIPSPADLELTVEIQDSCIRLGIAVVDHIIVGRGQMYSVINKKML